MAIDAKPTNAHDELEEHSVSGLVLLDGDEVTSEEEDSTGNANITHSRSHHDLLGINYRMGKIDGMAVEYGRKDCIIYMIGYMDEEVSYETGVGIVFQFNSFSKPVFVPKG